MTAGEGGTATAAGDAAAVEARSLTVSLWANLFMAVTGILAAWLSHSDAVLIDGLYSAVNFAAAIVARRVGASVARRPDRSRPFGYDADEALYVTFRSMVLVGILVFAALTAATKIFTYLAEDEAPDLVFGPIVVYGAMMVVICLGLAWLHHRNWLRGGRRSEILRTEARAALVDGAISAGTAVALFLVQFLQGTALAPVVPVADAIVVLILVILIGPQPVGLFLNALREVAGGSAPGHHVQTADAIARRLCGELGFVLRDLAVLKMGRSFYIVAYADPQRPVAATEIDAANDRLAAECRATFGNARSEIVVTATTRHGAVPD